MNREVNHNASYTAIICKIGGKSIVDNSNHIKSLSIDRAWGDVANDFKMEIFDATAYEIESLLINGNRNIEVMWVDADGKTSALYTGFIWDYSTTFVNNGIMLSLEGTVGVSVQDIYTQWTRLWNKVYIFNWKDFCGKSFISAEKKAEHDLTAAKFEKYIDDVMTGKKRVSATEALEAYLSQEAATIPIISAIYNTDSEGIFNYNTDIKVDADGQYYIKNIDGDKKDEIQKCTEFEIPVRPSDIVKLLAIGGKMIYLLKGSPDGIIKGIESKLADFNVNLTYGDKSYEKYADMPDEVKCMIEKALEACEDLEGNGWVLGDIDDTLPVKVDLSQQKLSDTNYITTILIPKSIRESDNESNYELYFDDNGRVNFKPIKIDVQSKAILRLGYYNPDIAYQNNTYTPENVISFTHKAPLSAALCGSELNETSGISYITGETITASSEEMGIKEKNVDIDDLRSIQLQVKHSPSNIITTTDSSIVSAQALNRWRTVASWPYEAELTMYGCIKLVPGRDYIDVINIPLNSLGKNLQYHHTSGKYLVQGISESFEGGVHTSKLTLLKNPGLSGVAEISTASDYAETSKKNK